MLAPTKRTNYICNLFLFFLINLVLCLNSFAQQKAFPTAYGGGAYASGGRGGYVYHVTNLNDSGIGSFRWAVAQPRPATIVFDVSGTIQLTNNLHIDGQDLTIAGQSAPEGGITFTNNQTNAFMSLNFLKNAIVRYIRVRMQPSGESYGLLAYGRDGDGGNIILDHLSLSYSGDEVLDVRGDDMQNITFQRGLIAEGKTGTLFGDTDSSNGGSFTYNNSFLTSLFVNISHRQPNIAGNGRFDVINNVIYDWKYRLTLAMSGAKLNHINNYYFMGGLQSYTYSFPTNPGDRQFLNQIIDNLGEIEIYTKGNVIHEDATNPNSDNNWMWTMFEGGNQWTPAPSDHFTNTMFPLIGEPLPIMTASEAAINVPSDVGANKFLKGDGTYGIYRDANDVDYINIVQTNTPEEFSNDGGYIDGDSYEYPSFVENQRYANFVASISNIPINTRPEGYYSSNPHIPEVWFQANVPNGQNHNDIAPSGYTWLEEYLNGVDGPIIPVSVESILVSPSVATLNIPDTINTVQLNTTFVPSNATNQNGSWSSSDDSIATVDSNGLVTPHGVGIAIIIFTSNDGSYSDSAIITVTNTTIPLELVSVNPENVTLDLGENMQLTTEFFPSNSTDTSGIWTTTNEEVVIVDENGMITTVGEGQANVIFTANDGGFSGGTLVTVDDNFFGTYELYDATSDELIQFIEGDTEITLFFTDNGINFRSIPNGGDDNSEVESVQVLWQGQDDGSWLENIPIYAGLSNHNDFDFEPYIVEEGTYDFTVKYYSEDSAEGELVAVDTFSLTFILDTTLVANAGIDQSICAGEVTTLTATGGTNFLWSTGETTASIDVNPIETTTYSVVVSNNAGDEATDEVVVTVNPLPVISINEEFNICTGESVTLTVEGEGESYLWSNGETSDSIIVNPTENTEYFVEVFANGCSTTVGTMVRVNESPNVSVTEDVTILLGNSTILTVSGADSYVWDNGETTNSISVTPIQTTTYSVIGYANGCESAAEVTVNVLESLSAYAGEDVSICIGESVVLNGSGGIFYEWSTGETTTSIQVSPATTTTFTLTVSDGQGSEDIDTVTVTVNDLPDVTASPDITIIEGDSTILTAFGAQTYLWNTGETSQSIIVNPTETTTYTVTGTSNSCESQSEVIVTVEPTFVASAGSDERVCDNDTYEVTLTANQGDSYLWSTGETTQSIVVSPLSTTIYTVSVVRGLQEDSDSVTVYVDPSPNVQIANGNSIDILNGDFVTLSASGANSYQWNNGATQPNIAVSPSATTTYEVKGYVGDCYDEKQVVVNVFQPVVADAGEDVYICIDETATLTASGGDEYLWSNGETTQSIEVSPTITTDYTVTVFNALDYDEASVRVEVDANCIEEPLDPIGDADLEFAFDVYPNPASSVVNVKLSGTLIISEIYMYDFTGKLIRQIIVDNDTLSSSTSTQIDVSSLQEGVYFVKLVDQYRDITKKLIIN